MQASISSRWVILSMVGLGVSTVLTQLALMREMLSAFSGNELVLGVALGSWLLLTGGGTWLGRSVQRRQDSVGDWCLGLTVLALMPLVQVVAIRVLRDRVFLAGAEVGLPATALSCFVVLLPYCLTSGYLLTLGCALLANGSRAAVGRHPGSEPDAADRAERVRRAGGRVYVADAVGSVVGGVTFSFVLIRWFDHFALLLIPALMNLLVAGLGGWAYGRRLMAGVAALMAAGLLTLVAVVDVDAESTAAQYPGQEVRWRANSPYGRMVVTESAGQWNVYENGVPLVATQSPERVEETVHYALVQRPTTAKVLLIGGGIAGTAREILKYAVQEVVCVELDPLAIDVARWFFPRHLDDPRIRTVSTDGRRFVRQTPERFDVVILDVPEPSTAQLNRLFTVEFFGEVKRVLAPGGVLGFGLGRYENYVSPELARLLSCVHRTLQTSFAQILVIPGGRVFFLASDTALHADLASRLEALRIPRQFVNTHYLDAMLRPDRWADMQRAVSSATPLNRDFGPVLYYEHLVRWLSQFNARIGRLQVVLAVVLILALLRLRGEALVLFASGFGASALQVVLLLAHQVLCGALYSQVGLIVTVFMAGLALGAWLANRSGASPSRKGLARLAMTLAVFAALLTVALPAIQPLTNTNVGAWLEQGWVPALTLVLAALVGAEFPTAARLAAGQKETSHADEICPDPANGATGQNTRAPEADPRAETIARLYTADFIGASLGALVASAWLVPVVGLAGVCWLTAGLNVWAGVALWLGRRPSS